jgi:hypothetical protein
MASEPAQALNPSLVLKAVAINPAGTIFDHKAEIVTWLTEIYYIFAAM